MALLPQTLAEGPCFLAHTLCALLCAWIELVAGLLKWVVKSLLGPRQEKGCANGFSGRSLGVYERRFKTKLAYKEGGELEYEIDHEASLEGSDFPIKPEKLIENARLLIKADFGVHDNSMLAEDFRFVAPVVGPLGKGEFLEAFGGFKLRLALPDLKDNHFNFFVDPWEPNRVWWMAAPTGTHTGAIPIPATGKRIEWPPQAQSVCFDEKGRCYQLTVGYCMDKQLGNTGGLGAVFGLAYAIGFPIPSPEGHPWTPSGLYTTGVLGGDIVKLIAKTLSAKGNEAKDK